jgi:hypothetical protein
VNALKKILKRKSSGGHQAKKEERREKINLSPRNRKACHSTSTALLNALKAIARISLDAQHN